MKHKGRQQESKRGTKKATRQKTINKISIISSSLSIITLNVNKLSSPIKRCRVARWIKNQD